MSQEFETLWEQVAETIDSGRMAHGYIIQGSPASSGGELVRRMLARLLAKETTANIEKHADVCWIEPQSKSRQIRVEDMQRMMNQLDRTSFEGGWKAGVIAYADRMNEQSANKFLKTLEEPPGRSLIILITENPESMLATIRSRCQLVAVPHDEVMDEQWRSALLDVLSLNPNAGVLGNLAVAGRVGEILHVAEKELSEGTNEEVEESAADEKVRIGREASKARLLRREALTLLQDWFRDVMLLQAGGAESRLNFPDYAEAARAQGQGQSRKACYKRIDRLERAASQLERNLPVVDVLELALAD